MAQTNLTTSAVFRLLTEAQIRVLTREQKKLLTEITRVSPRKGMRVILDSNKGFNPKAVLLHKGLGLHHLRLPAKAQGAQLIRDQNRLRKRVLQQIKIMQVRITPEIIQGRRHLLLRSANNKLIQDELCLLSKINQMGIRRQEVMLNEGAMHKQARKLKQ